MFGERFLRIGDNLDDLSKKVRSERFINFDKLAVKVFDPELADTKVDEFYINTQSDPLNPGDFFDLPIFTHLGAFERLLLSLFLKPDKRIYIITGEAGCGKTTSITYLINRLSELPDYQPDDMFPIRLNLNESMYENRNEHIAKDLLYKELSSRLLGILRVNGLITEEIELVDFWNQGLLDEKKYQKSRQTLFSDIASNLKNAKQLEITDSNYLAIFEDREHALAELKASPNKYFNYILRLWDYSLKTNNKQQRSFIIIDNIDKASLNVQSSLLSLLNDISSDPGPCVFVTMRPETFISLNMKSYKKSKSVEIIKHPGFKASLIIKNRIERFVTNKDEYYDGYDGLSHEQYDSIYNFMSTLLRIYSSERSSRHTDFLDAASGNNLRLALCLAQKYFGISIMEFNEGAISPHTLNRVVVVNQGEAQHREHIRSLIPNLFELRTDKDTTPLLKYRILCFLNSQPHHTAAQINVRMEMVGFGYGELEDVKGGLSDLLDYSYNLLISDGLEKYDSDNEYFQSANNQLSLSSKGKNYYDKIIYNLDYIQEIMLDSYLPSSWVQKRLPFSNLPEKFLLLLDYINYLHDIDLKETTNYIRYGFSKSDYHNHYGSELLTLTLLKNCCSSILNIYIKKRNSLSRTEQDDFKSVFNKAVAYLYNYNSKNLNLIGISSVTVEDILSNIQEKTGIMKERTSYSVSK